MIESVFSYRRIWLYSILTVLLINAVLPLSAHGYIVRSIPEDRVTLQRPPTRLQYWFSEDLEPAFSSINLRDQSGNIIAQGGVDEENLTLLALQVPSNLSNAAYIVELRPAFASDGHVVAESRVFFVGDEVGGVEGREASDQAVALEVVWRILVLPSAIMLFGVHILYAMTLIPAWGSNRYPAGLLPPRIMKRLNWIVAIAMVVLVIGNLLALIQQTMVFFNVDADQVLEGGLWQVVRIGSRFGDVWNIRMIFLGIAVLLFIGSIYYRTSQPKTVRAFWTANSWIFAFIIGTFSINSHAVGSLISPWIALLADWLHALSVAFWVGGILSLVLILPPALKPYQGDERQQALVAVMGRFSYYLAGMVALVITTGMYSAFNYLYTPLDVSTTYGVALGLKLVMVALLVFIGALHHLALRPHLLEQWGVLRITSNLVNRARSFRITLYLEFAVVVVVLVLVGLLTATPVPEPAFAQQQIETPVATQQVNQYEITSAVIPGGPGVNTYDTVVRRGTSEQTPIDVQVQIVNPDRDWRSAWLATDFVDDGLYVTAGDEMNQEGRWLSLIDVIDEAGIRTRSVFEWDISNEASVIQTQPMGIQHILALLGVFGTIGWILYPSAKTMYEKLDLSPLNVLVAVGAVSLSIILLMGGALLVEEQQRIYDESLNPPPKIINPILPDMASLSQGEILYSEHCLLWQQFSRDFRTLRQQLTIIRDEELFQAITVGWRELPACGGALADEERWHIVNYFRTLGL